MLHGNINYERTKSNETAEACFERNVDRMFTTSDEGKIN